MLFSEKIKLNGQTYEFGEIVVPPRAVSGNTLVYYPFDTDINDHSGNGYDLTAVGSAYSFTTNSDNIACMELNPQDSDVTYFTAPITSSEIELPTQDYTFVCRICDNSTTANSSWAIASMFSLNQPFSRPSISQMTEVPDNIGLLGLGWDSWAQTFVDGDQNYSISVTGPNFHTFVCTWNHNTRQAKMYVDGEYISTYSLSGGRNVDFLYIGRNSYDSGEGRFIHAKIKDVLIETREWTEDEIAHWFL